MYIFPPFFSNRQLKAMSGDWMKEFKRSASEKIRTPSANMANTLTTSGVGTTGGATNANSITSATENFGRSIKESFKAGKFKNKSAR